MAYVDHRGYTEIRLFAYPEPLRWSRRTSRRYASGSACSDRNPLSMCRAMSSSILALSGCDMASSLRGRARSIRSAREVVEELVAEVGRRNGLGEVAVDGEIG